jgi:hypothetical protein
MDGKPSTDNRKPTTFPQNKFAFPEKRLTFAHLLAVGVSIWYQQVT